MTDRTARTPSAFRLNLEQQKKRARELLCAAQAGEADALVRIAAPLSSTRHAAPSRHPAPPRLADALLAIARELRFASWARLKFHIEGLERQRAAIDGGQPAPDGDLKTLHIRCGHDIRDTLAQAGFTGGFHAHITPYCQGPVTRGPQRHALMARFIVDAFAGFVGGSRPLQYEDVLAAEQREDEILLASADDYERVVLWLEHDSYDQLALLRLLSHYANARRPRVLELIAVDEFPGGERFIGVGQLPPEALRLLWSTRAPVTAAQLALGCAAWNALVEADPRALAAIARAGTPQIPTLAPALYRHLRELPSLENGLSLSEQLILQVLAERETTTLREVFRISQHEREPLPFLGDAGVARVVREMERAAAAPLLRTATTVDEPMLDNRLQITDAGRAVLSGACDWHALQPLPRWVGGVHIVPGRPGWRWSETRRTVVAA